MANISSVRFCLEGSLKFSPPQNLFIIYSPSRHPFNGINVLTFFLSTIFTVTAQCGC